MITKEIKFVFLAILLLNGCSISVDQTTLDFGSTETEKTFCLEVKGILKWSIEADKDWVVVEPSEGSKSTNIKVNVKRTGLVEGAYESKLSVQTNPKASNPIITVKMSVVSTQSIEYEYTELLPEGWSSASVTGINDTGDVVGSGIDATGIGRGFVYSDGAYTFLLPAGWSSASATGINNNGEVVGWVSNASNELYHFYGKGFIYSSGNYTFILPEGWSIAYDLDINNNGDVIGSGEDADGIAKGFIYSGGQYTVLLPEGWWAAYAYGINDNEEVVGYGQDAVEGITKGFIYRNGQYTELLPPGWVSAAANDINKNGDVVGSGNAGTGEIHGGGKGFIYSGGNYSFILPEGYLNAAATSINDNGEVVGYEPSHIFPGNGFIYSNDKFTYLLPEVVPSGINNKGVVIGYKIYTEGGVNWRGFIATPVTK
jgi:uncharacterized membrane protein